MDVIELIASTDVPETSIAIEFLKNKLGKSRILDCLMALLRDNQVIFLKYEKSQEEYPFIQCYPYIADTAIHLPDKWSLTY